MNISKRISDLDFIAKTAIPSFSYRVGIRKGRDGKHSLIMDDTAPYERWRELFLMDMFEEHIIIQSKQNNIVSLGDWAIPCLIRYRFMLAGVLNTIEEHSIF